jgi:formate dehydrogenase major subunit
MNDRSRLTQPMLKVNGKFEPISFEQAYDLIAEKIKAVKPEENYFFAGARLTNEEMYLVQKLARAGAQTNNVSSFHYFGRGSGYRNNSLANVPLDQLEGASRFILLGSEINTDHAVAGFMVNNISFRKGIPVEVVTVLEHSSMEYKVDGVMKIKSYYHFLKAVNHYLISLNLQNQLFINDRCEGYEEYKAALLAEDFTALLKESGISEETLIRWAVDYNNEMNAVVFFSEKELSGRACQELFNLAMITGKLSKTANGLVALKEKNNAHGLYDMGVHPETGPGYGSMNDENYRKVLQEVWNISDLPTEHSCTFDAYKNKAFKNLFIFGEDPLGCAVNPDEVKEFLSKASFKVVQDYFLTATAEQADLVLPASLPAETGGSFTNTQKMIQHFDAGLHPVVEHTSWQQLSELLKKFGLNGIASPADALNEAFTILQETQRDEKFHFRHTESDNHNRLFEHGCDAVNKRFDEEFGEVME